MHRFRAFQPSKVLLILLALVLAWPVLVVFGSWSQWNTGSAQVLQAMASTVLLEYALTSGALCVLVGIGVTVLGSCCAVIVTMFDFPGRRQAEWLMLMPLAVPAYVVAYAYTDFLQFSGPLQTALRAATGWRGSLLPDVRSLPGAAFVLVLALYPYVYLLARAALAERATRLMEAARLLGASMPRRILMVALPLARPAIAAGVALALMETLADFGVTSYFGVQTFATGIYKAWLAQDDRIAAAQLATMLLVLVLLLLYVEQATQRRMRFADARQPAGAQSGESGPHRLVGWQVGLVWVLCAVPVVLGFVLPLLVMAMPLAASDVELPWRSFMQWSLNSLQLSGFTAVLAVAIALMLGHGLRARGGVLLQGVARLAGVGYAVPGAVIVVGLLLPIGWLQQWVPNLRPGYWITATVLGLIWAYLVRFTAVAMQSVTSGYARIPGSLDDTGRLLGLHGRHLFTRIHLPLMKRSIAAALLLVFVDVMKELPATMVLRPFDSDTLAVVTYQLARDERLAEASLPALALVLVGLIPVLLLSRTMRTRI